MGDNSRVNIMIEWDMDNLRFIDKKVSDYSGRKRINITNNDGLVKDDEVVIMKKSDHDALMTDYMRLIKMEQEQDNSKVTSDAIAEKFITPITDSYDDIIDGLNDKIDAKDKEINRLKAIYQEYDKQVYSLGFIDILKHRNRDISDDFNNKIWINPDDNMVTDAEVKKLTGDDNGGQEE